MLQNRAPNPISTLEISLIVPIKENVIRVKFDRQSKIKKQSSECSLIVIRVNIRVERGNSSRKLNKRNEKYYVYLSDSRVWMIEQKCSETLILLKIN